MPKEIEPIDFRKIINIIWKGKKTFLYPLAIAFILSSLFIISIPRYYKSEVKLAPELISTGMNGLNSLASSFGVDMAVKMGQNQDAISPELYPDLIQSQDFRVSLFPIKVKTVTNQQFNFYTYLKDNQQAPWWDKAKGKFLQLFIKEEKSTFNGETAPSPFWLSKAQDDIARTIGNNINCTIDKKTDVISISLQDQDPLVAATVVDSVRVRLQNFITDYRTKKARNDRDFVRKMQEIAKAKYVAARQRYGAYSDANTDIVLTSYKLKQTDLENDMQLLYNNYSELTNQLHTAEAKVQEHTPAFTTLQSATVPLKPAGPQRMIFVITILFLTFLGTSIYILMKGKN
ncbi:MAG: chain-length determining protein [Bacteroidota bacterium]|nr:chain-length determining protein [Bacteroidota bacterium]